MKKLLVLAIVLTLSLSLVWAADGIKNTDQNAKGKPTLAPAAPGSQAVNPAQTPKAPLPAKVTDDATIIDPNAINETPAIQSQQSQSAPAEKAPVLHKATPLGDGIDKEAVILEALQQEAQVGKWEPQYGEKGEILNAEPTINTLGFNQDNSDLPPVIASILLSETFHQTGWDIDTPPLYWTAIDSGTEGSQTWYVDDWHKFYFSTMADTVLASGWSTSAMSESLMIDWLITPTIDLSTATTCSLYLKEYYDNVATASDSANIMVSIDNGSTWVRVRKFAADSTTVRTRGVELTPYVGNSTVKIGFQHCRLVPSTASNGWVVDSIRVSIDGVTPWVQDVSGQMAGWFGNTPPAGPGGAWDIQDLGNVSRPKAKNANDWNRRVGNLGNDTVAACTYTSSNNRREFENEWLISPSFEILGNVACTLSLNEYWNFDAASSFFPPGGTTVNEHGYIKIQETTDGGTTWEPWQIVADHNNVGLGTSNTAPPYRGKYSLHTWRGKTVRLGFQKVAPPEASFATWYMSHLQVDDYTMLDDDVATTAILAPTVAHSAGAWPVKSRVLNVGNNTETFQDSTYIQIPNKNTLMIEGFGLPVGWTGANPPTGWTVLDSGSVPGWQIQDWHQFYNSASLDTVARVYYASGVNQNEWLVSPVVNCTAEPNVHLTFRTFFNWEGTTDTAYIFGTTDNWATRVMIDKWYTDHGTDAVLGRYDYDISAWAGGQANVQVAFKYLALYDLYWMVDDVELYAPLAPTLVYQNGETVTGLAPFGSADVSYTATWNTPAAGAYQIKSFTALTGDGNTANDALMSDITVYPHTSTAGPDAGFYSFIDSWAPGGPAFNWVDMSAGTYVTFSSQEYGYTATPIAMGGPFFYYGTMYDSLSLLCPGYVALGRVSTYYYVNTSIPNAAAPNNYIGFMWDDMLVQGLTTGARYWEDTANNRFVVEYPNIQFYSSTPSSDTFDCQIILNRADSSITLQYRQLGTAMQTDATIGIENSTGTIGLSYFFESNIGNYPTEELAIKYFYTAPASNVGIASFDAPNGFLDATVPYTMMATAQNYTANAATFDVEFYADAALIGTVTGVNLAGLASQQVSCPNTWTPTTTGTHSLQAKTVYPGDSDPFNDQITVSRTALSAPVVAPFSTDFESNNGGFAGTNEWEYGTPTYSLGPAAAHSGTNLWGTDLDNQYDFSTWNILYFPPVDLSAMTAPELKFWMWHAFETNWDGANVKVSTDNGTTWTLFFGTPVYNDTANASTPGVGGQAVYSGSADWTQVSFDLTAYAGSTILLKVDQGADGSGQFAGIYIDDIGVAEIPADDIGVTAILAPGAITIQGFSWQVVANVHNFGAGTQTNVPVYFEIYDILNNLVYTDTYTLPTLEGGADSVVFFADWSPAEADTHTFVSYTILAADIDHSNDTSLVTSYTYSHVGNGGPSNNYTFADNVNGGGPDINWVDISTVGTSMFGSNIDDANSGFIPMGMTFKFFGVDYTQIAVCTNGWVSFTDASSTDYTESAIPDADGPAGMVALFWDDMSTRTGHVYYYYDSIENQFIVQYDSVEFLSPSGSDIGMEVIFDGDDNSISMQYLYFALGAQTDCTVGIENASETSGLAYDNFGQVGQTPLAGVAITWTYTPPDVDVEFVTTVGQVAASGSVPVCATFNNTGGDDGNVSAHFEVLDESSVVVFTGNGTGTVPAGGTANICASTNWAATPGEYTINVTATVADDGDPLNNDGSGSIIISGAVGTYPVFEDFENAATVFPPPGWTILHLGDGTDPNATWIEDNLVYRSPTTSAFQDDDPGDAFKDEWLVMQPTDFSLAFQPLWKFYEVGNYFANYGIAHEFYVGTGMVFDMNTATLVAQHLPGVHVVPASWDLGDAIDLSAFEGEPVVWCAIRYIGFYSDEWWIDDVSINGPDMYDAQVDAVTPSATLVEPGDLVSLQVELSNNGYLPIVATLTTIGVGSTSGEVYNNVTTDINIGGFGSTVVNLPDFATVPACGETYDFTATVATAGDTVVTNNIGLATVATGFTYEVGNIDEITAYYWPVPWYYARKAYKPAVGVIDHAIVNYIDYTLSNVTFDFLIIADSAGVPGHQVLYGPVTVPNAFPASTPVDIRAIAPTLPDSFFYVVRDYFGSSPNFIGILSDAGELGGADSYRAVDDLMNWEDYPPYTWAISHLVDGRDAGFLDLSPVSVDAPGSVVIGPGPFAVSGTVANIGLGDVVGGSARMVITGTAGTDFDVTMPVDLLAGATLPVNFGNWAPSNGGETYTLTMTVSVPSEGDACNNTITSSALAITGAIAAFEDFEVDNGGFVGSGVWQHGAPTFVNGPAPYSGVNVWGTVLAGNYPIDACDSLRTPVFEAPAIGGAMVFYLWYSTEYDWDGLNVKVSVDGGPYTIVTPVGGYDLTEQGYLCDLMISMEYYTGSSGGWVPKAVDLTPYAGQNVSFSFDFGSDGSVVLPGAYIDDFVIYDYFPVAEALVTPLTLSFTQDEDTTITYPSTFTIYNVGLADMNYTATTSLPWITLGGVAGLLTPGSGNAIDVIVNSTGITAGTYMDSVTVTSDDPVNPVIYKPVIEVVVEQGGCVYIPGDINGVGGANGIDVTYGVTYFKGGPVPPTTCDMCPQPAPFYAAGDVNGSCTFNGIDITYFVSYLKGGPALTYCATCPPVGIVAAPAVITPSPKATESEVGGQ